MSKQAVKRDNIPSRDNTRRYSEGDADYVHIAKALDRHLSSVDDNESDSEMSETSEDKEESSFDEEEYERKKQELAEITRQVERMKKEKKKKVSRGKKHQQEKANRSEGGFSIEGGETSEEINTNVQTKTGLVVICHHSKFKLRSHSLSARLSSHADMKMMDSIWKEYGCEVLSFNEETNEFYTKQLVKEITEKVKPMSQVSFFAFVLSTHGEEKEECKIDGIPYFQHYFYTSDGQIQTQQLINDIAGIDQLNDKIKMFFIQACRSRAYPDNEDKNVELGFELKMRCTLSEKNATASISVEEDVYLRSGMSISDARGYMPVEEEPIVLDYTPTVWVPHCEDCIVVFASMSGKFAYSLANSQYEGGWLIKSLDDVLSSYKIGDEVHIMDVLTEVNRRVGNRETDYNKKHGGVLKAQSCAFYNISEDLYLKRS